MITKLALLILAIGTSSTVYSQGIQEFKIPFGNKLSKAAAEGSVTVNLDTSTQAAIKIDKGFYGVDSHGFSALPKGSLVTPLQVGLVKLGGSLHSTFNWELDAYFQRNENEIYYVYSPLARRLEYIQKNYNAIPMFQVNMLGWQPDLDSTGKLTYQNTASASHAGDAIAYINGTQKLGLKHILMGNEPFESQDEHGIPSPSADEYIEKYFEYAVAVRNAEENISGNANDIKLWGPEIATGWTGWQTNHPSDCTVNNKQRTICSYGNGKFTEFMPYFLFRMAEFEKDEVRNPKRYKMVDYITFHYYPLFRTDFKDTTSILRDKNGNQMVSEMLESVNLWDSKSYINNYDGASPKGVAPMIIQKFKNWRQQFYPDAKIATTEFAIDSIDKINYHPIVRPLYLADLMARAAASGLDTFVNSFLQGGSSANSWAMIDGEDKTRLYYVYSLFSNYFLGDVLATYDDFGDMINSYSVRTTDSVNVFVINKDMKNHKVDLRLITKNISESLSLIDLPAWSMTVLNVPHNRNETITVHQYGAKEMGVKISLKN